MSDPCAGDTPLRALAAGSASTPDDDDDEDAASAAPRVDAAAALDALKQQRTPSDVAGPSSESSPIDVTAASRLPLQEESPNEPEDHLRVHDTQDTQSLPEATLDTQQQPCKPDAEQAVRGHCEVP